MSDFTRVKKVLKASLFVGVKTRHLQPVVLTKKQKCNRRDRNQMNKQLNLLSKTVLWIFPVINGFLMPAEFYISALTMTCLGLRNAFVRPNFSAFEG